MYKIGITGSIGTGKTTIANMFALFNIPIFDADREIREIRENLQISSTFWRKCCNFCEILKIDFNNLTKINN